MNLRPAKYEAEVLRHSVIFIKKSNKIMKMKIITYIGLIKD
jgi:hypothetical protein